jgi:phosphatidate cytidylyltransferase
MPVLVLAIWFGLPWFALLVTTAAVLGFVEFNSMVFGRWWWPLTLLGGVWTTFFILNAYYAASYGSEIARLGGTLGLIASAALVLAVSDRLRRRASGYIPGGWLWTLTGILYMGWLLGYWVLLMNSYGREWVFVALLATFAVDTSAYFVGRFWGRRKLAPTISPGKTWEGAIGGLLGAVLAATLLSLVFDLDTGYSRVVVLGLLVGVFAQLGDLTESKLKRIVGVKEAGSIIPGHGGILDRLDSIAFAGIVAYYWLQYCC